MPEPQMTAHARQRARQRGITEEQVREALAHEQRRSPGQPGSFWVFGLVTGGRILKVCLTTDRTWITTVVWPD